MSTDVMQTRSIADSQVNFSDIQRYVLMRFHPRSIFIDSVGMIWFTYFLWGHNWMMAVGVAIVARLCAFMAVVNVNTELFADTVLGRIGLLLLNVLNFSIQIVGAIALIFGIWEHSTEIILGGLSVVLLGHLFGWDKVDARLSDRSEVLKFG